MVELLGALAVPVGKLLLKYGVSADVADVGGSLFQLAFKRLGERQKAAEAEGKARAVGEAVVADLGQALKVERGKEHDLRAAAEELAVTIGEHVRAELVVGPAARPGADRGGDPGGAAGRAAVPARRSGARLLPAARGGAGAAAAGGRGRDAGLRGRARRRHPGDARRAEPEHARHPGGRAGDRERAAGGGGAAARGGGDPRGALPRAAGGGGPQAHPLRRRPRRAHAARAAALDRLHPAPAPPRPGGRGGWRPAARLPGAAGGAAAARRPAADRGRRRLGQDDADAVDGARGAAHPGRPGAKADGLGGAVRPARGRGPGNRQS